MKFDINDYKGNYVMHCKTEEEARDFCKYLHSVGKKWSTGESYLEKTMYHHYEESTTYNFNEGAFSDVAWYKCHGYIMLEWSDFMNGEFTKADLKTGDIVMQRDGLVQIANCELDMFITKNGWNDMNCVNSDLTHKVYDAYDIVAVRRPVEKGDCQFNAFECEYGTLVYERKEVEEMTLEEVCRLLGKEIKIVK